MKILWMTNIAFSYHNEMLGYSTTQSSGGSWLYAAYDAVKTDDNIELHIVTSSDVKNYMSRKFGNSFFHLLPGGGLVTYNHASSYNRQMCEKLKRDVCPDIVVIWGTESKLAYLLSDVFKDTPIVVYMQGVIQSIYQRYFDGVPSFCRYRTFRDFIDVFNKRERYKNFRDQSKLERGILLNAKAVIVENDWCEDQCKMLNPNLMIFRNELPIRAEYYRHDWKLAQMERNTIFVNAGGYPIKGHHILLQAIALVKNIYPDVKVYIPGDNYLKVYSSLKHKTGYFKWLQSIVDKYNLMENLVFTGRLTPNEMSQHLERCNVFVMPSVCENHSSSLIEAMIVGAPCVSSLVGGVGTLIENKKNGIIYDSVDYVALAGNIVRILSDESLASELSKNAKMIRIRNEADFGAEMNLIYKSIII